MQPALHLLLLAFLLTSAQAEQLVIVSLNKDQKIAVYQLNEDKGNLTLRSTLPVDSGPGAMCLNPAGTKLYVGKVNGTIAAYHIAKDATLNPIGECSPVARPSFISFHPSGKFLFSAYYKAGQIAVHRVGADGKLSDEPIQIVKTTEKAHCIVCDPTGKTVLVPHTAPNLIYNFAFDAETGTLKAPNHYALQTDPDTGPRHIFFHPTNGHAYGSNEKGSSVTLYRYIETMNSLGTLQTVSTLPEEGIEGRKSTSDIEVHPSGKFVYVANRGFNTIASFAIDEKSGKMTPITQTPTEAVTRSFNITPNGHHLIAAGTQSGNLAVFRIDDEGFLTRTSTLYIGKNPWWVQALER